MKRLKSLKLSAILLAAVLAVGACKKNATPPPFNEDVDLDGKKINDSSLIHPENYLLSAAILNPTPADLSKYVVITAHGFSATNFEWSEFNDWSKGKTDLLVSRVLLGGHGRDYEDFKLATWIDWQAPIIEEYNKLRQMGYQKISIAGSSTGCPLVLNLVANNKINTDVLKHLFFIDPIILPSNKSLSLVKVIGPLLGYTETTMAPGENGYWYKFLPEKALQELEHITKKERKELEKGIVLPSNVTLNVYKAEQDGSADPASAVLLDQGVKTSDGSSISVVMVNTDMHVFTRLRGRESITSEQRNLQLQTFQEIYSELKN
ncbi:MAG: esterase [bacterium]|nr:esterase [bacterium]